MSTQEHAYEHTVSNVVIP